MFRTSLRRLLRSFPICVHPCSSVVEFWERAADSLLNRADVFRADHNVVEPDAIDRIRPGHMVLAPGEFSHVMQQPEKVDLELVVRPPAKAFKRFATLPHERKAHTGPATPS